MVLPLHAAACAVQLKPIHFHNKTQGMIVRMKGTHLPTSEGVISAGDALRN